MQLEAPKGELTVKKIPFFPLLEPIRPHVETYDDESKIEALFAGRDPDAVYQSKLKFQLQDTFHHEYPQYPALLNADGSPWALGNLYLMQEVVKYSPANSETLLKTAIALRRFARVLVGLDLDMFYFPKRKAKRPTYAFSYHLKEIVDEDPEKEQAANEAIYKVIGFYNWAVCERGLNPEHAMWVESEEFVTFENEHGSKITKKRIITDLPVKTSGVKPETKLRAYNENEQIAICQALQEVGNPEMTLAFMFGLTTSARLQTVLTMSPSALSDFANQDYYMIPVGRGAFADTKGNKRIVLHVPSWLVKKIKVYLRSERYSQRVDDYERISDKGFSYIFLTRTGRPYYSLRRDNNSLGMRTKPTGKAVEAFIRQQLNPVLAANGHKLKVRFHNLRATFANNLVRENQELLNRGAISMNKLLSIVGERLGHSSVTQTEKYIKKLLLEEATFVAQSKMELFFEKSLDVQGVPHD